MSAEKKVPCEAVLSSRSTSGMNHRSPPSAPNFNIEPAPSLRVNLSLHLSGPLQPPFLPNVSADSLYRSPSSHFLIKTNPLLPLALFNHSQSTKGSPTTSTAWRGDSEGRGRRIKGRTHKFYASLATETSYFAQQLKVHKKKGPIYKIFGT